LSAAEMWTGYGNNIFPLLVDKAEYVAATENSIFEATFVKTFTAIQTEEQP